MHFVFSLYSTKIMMFIMIIQIIYLVLKSFIVSIIGWKSCDFSMFLDSSWTQSATFLSFCCLQVSSSCLTWENAKLMCLIQRYFFSYDVINFQSEMINDLPLISHSNLVAPKLLVLKYRWIYSQFRKLLVPENLPIFLLQVYLNSFSIQYIIQCMDE